MTIITNNYEKVITEMIISKFSDNLRKVSTDITYQNSVFKYIDKKDGSLITGELSFFLYL